MYGQLTETGCVELHSGFIEWDAQNYCTAAALVKDGKAEQFRVVPLLETQPPEIDPATQTVFRDGCELIDGKWRYKWTVRYLTQEELAAAISEKKAALAQKIETLWQSANNYTSSYISGVAIGLLTIGTLQQLPKALAVTAWSSAVWDEYYRRKALVTATSEDDLDFSAFGPMPYSVPELREELGL